jgi:NitT/TauT family transport system substrate-binding protein
LTVVTVVGGGPSSGAAPEVTATLLLAGTPGATVGGYIDAPSTSVAKSEHLDLVLKAAGPAVFDTIPQVASGETDFTVTGTTLLFPARAQHIPIVQLFAAIGSPICVMSHPTQHITTWSQLSGHTIEVTPGAAWWTYVKNKYHLTNMNVVNYSGSLAEFIANKKMTQQCFITNEPYVATQQGVPNSAMLVSTTGFDPYDNVLVTTQKEISSDSTLVEDVVKAIVAGWQEFWAHPTSAYAKLPSYGTTEKIGEMKYQYSKLKGIRTTPVGYQEPSRMHLTAEQEASVKAIPESDVAGWQGSFTNKFLP